ncbi:hypothetical protein A2U01_0050085, partial [Trifolium medium]|nr:hypothetical protein [Trifolium medium]
GSRARCAVHAAIAGILSGICASRSLEWRGAQLNQNHQDEPQEVARHAGWLGAARQYKNSRLKGVTATCASHRADGAVRQHGKLCKICAFNEEER